MVSGGSPKNFKDYWENGLKGVNWSKGGGPLFYCHPVEFENGLLNLKTQTKSFTMLGKAKIGFPLPGLRHFQVQT